MITVGVDLAAEAARTAVARLGWSGGRCVADRVEIGADDEAVLGAVLGSGKAGIDCPLGWPDAFVDFVAAHRTGRVTVPGGVPGSDWRRLLANRRTDLVVRERTGLVPLSVAADRIARPTMRCAALLADLSRRGASTVRDGTGLIAEVYPAASLLGWGLAHRGYKRPANRAALGRLVDALIAAAPWLDLGPHEAVCRRSDDAFDAVVAALTARAVALGLTIGPAPGQAGAARTEGWIALPAAPLSALRPDAH